MRMARDMLGILALITLVGVIMHVRDAKASRVEQADVVAQDLRRLQLEIKLRSAASRGDLNERGWPVTISPEWFSGRPPRNTLVAPSHPWVEIASAQEQEQELEHPLTRMTINADTAGFWYNPWNGIVRARVPVMLSDENATDLYNAVNGSSFGSIFETETARAPVIEAETTPSDEEKDPDDIDELPPLPGMVPDDADEDVLDPTRPVDGAPDASNDPVT